MKFVDEMDGESIVFGCVITMDNLPLSLSIDYETDRIRIYKQTVAEFSTASTAANFRRLEIARHALVGSQSEPAVTVLRECCANPYVSMPTVFSVELRFVLDNADSLVATQLVDVLETLAEHFGAYNDTMSEQNPLLWPCLDTLIRLQTVDLLRYVSTEMDWTQLVDESIVERCLAVVAELYGELLTTCWAPAGMPKRAENNVIRVHCMRSFVEAGPMVTNSNVVMRTMQECDWLQPEIGRIYRKEHRGNGAGYCQAESVNVRYKHICEGRSEQQIEEAVVNYGLIRRILRLPDTNGHYDRQEMFHN